MDHEERYSTPINMNHIDSNEEYDYKKDSIWRQKSEDKVNHPPHYCQGGIEVIDIIESAVTGLEPFEAFCTGNAIKYLCRWKHKNGVEDLQKAIWYINKLIEHNSGE